MVYITGIKQSLNSFLYVQSDTDTNPTFTGLPTIAFNEAPPAGVAVQISYIIPVPTPGNTTQIVVNSFLGTGQQEIYNLSVTPLTIDYVFVYVSGILMHSNTYSVSGNQLIIPDSIQEYLSICVVIFQNGLSGGVPVSQLAGIVTGALVTNSLLVFAAI